MRNISMNKKTIELDFQSIVDMANNNNALMDGTMEPVLNILRSHEVVIGVWQDVESPNGFDTLIIKGISLVRNAYCSEGGPCSALVTAIAVVCPEQAEALRQLHGGMDVLQ